MPDNLIVSTSPHIHTKVSAGRIMWLVVLSLIPAGAAGVLIFGMRALWIIVLGVLSALLTEGAIQVWSRKKVTLNDGSALLTGLLLAYNLPVSVPFWIPVVGAFFAIAIAKAAFGGLGKNIFNPALAARAFLMASWPKYMTAFVAPGHDTITSATPLTILKETRLVENISYIDLFLGNRAGSLGEVCILALLAGATFLLIKGYITWHIPLTYILTTGLFTFVFGGQGLFSGNWLFHILNGGLILGAFFMATDYVTCPLTPKGQIIFGIGCGLLTGIIRLWGGYPEGVCYSILIMNAVVPLLDRYVRPRIYGTR